MSVWPRCDGCRSQERGQEVPFRGRGCKGMALDRNSADNCMQGSEQLWEKGRRNLIWPGQEERVEIQMWWLEPDGWGNETGM